MKKWWSQNQKEKNVEKTNRNDSESKTPENSTFSKQGVSRFYYGDENRAKKLAENQRFSIKPGPSKDLTNRLLDTNNPSKVNSTEVKNSSQSDIDKAEKFLNSMNYEDLCKIIGKMRKAFSHPNLSSIQLGNVTGSFSRLKNRDASDRGKILEQLKRNVQKNPELLRGFEWLAQQADFATQPEGTTIFPGRFVAKAAWEGMQEAESQPISWTRPMRWLQQQKLASPSVRACVPSVVLART